MLLKTLIVMALAAAVGGSVPHGVFRPLARRPPVRLPPIPPSGIVRPCPRLDLACVRANFARNSRCNPRVPGAAPAVYSVPSAWFEANYFNATYQDKNLLVRGQDRCRVAEFFFDMSKSPAGGVLGVECPWLNFASERVLYQHATFREDTVYRFNINGTYPMIRMTTSLADAAALDICREYTFVEVSALPIFHVDPKDRKTSRDLSTDSSVLNIYERELFASRANMLARTFINNAICDFGCR